MVDALTPAVCKHQRNARGLSLRDLSRAARVREEFIRLYEANRYDLGSYSLEQLSAALKAAETSEEAANA